MAIDARSHDEIDDGQDSAALAATVLEEEAKRQAKQASLSADVVLPDDLLPGVGGEGMALREVLDRGGRATIVVLFGLGMADNLINSGAFSVLAPDIQDAFDLSDSAIGLIGALAGFTTFAAAIPLGWLGDRMRRTLIAGATTIVWSLFAALTGMVNAIWQLVAARVATGMGQANEGPIQSSILADAYPPEGRGRIFGIHRAANPVGALLGPALAGGIAAMAGGDEGWRWAFIILAIPALVLGVAALFVPEPKRGRHEQLLVLGEELDVAPDEAPISLGAAFARLKKIKSFYYLMASLGAFGIGVFTVPIYLNLILEEELGLSAAERGVVGTITATGSLVGALVGGRYADVLFRRSPELTLRFMAGGLAVLGVSFAIQAHSPNVVFYVAVGIAAHFCLWAAIAPASPTVAAIVPYRLRSIGYAMVGLYLTMVGGVGGAIIVGTIADRSSERVAVTIVAPLAAVLAAGVLTYGSRFVRGDIARAVTDLLEERDETQRMAAGGDVSMLQVRNLDFSYGSVQVLFDVNLDVQQGEVLALLGTNGAGKSTLLRAISGIGLADRGVVRFHGRTITYAEPASRVRMGIVQVPGGRAIFPSLSVGDNLRAGAFLMKDAQEIRARTEQVLALFPRLAECVDQRAGTLSGGEQQMLAIAKALLLEPKVLLIDELSLGLAPVVVTELLGVVERLKEEGVTIVVVEQSVNVALTLADRAVFMERGQIRFDGPAHELLDRDDLVRAVFLGGEGG